MKNKKKFLIFFGPPASGKGTQSDNLGKKLALPVISTGELLRAEQEKKTSLGRAVLKDMAQGKLVGEKIIARIISQRLLRPDVKNGFIMDGFPRSLEQFDLLKKIFAKLAGPDDLIVGIYISCSDNEIKKRVTGRRVCECGASYHLIYNPPKKTNHCDICGRKLLQRNDDKPSVVNARLKLFYFEMQPLLKRMIADYNLVTINGNQSIGQARKEIWSKIKKLI